MRIGGEGTGTALVRIGQVLIGADGGLFVIQALDRAILVLDAQGRRAGTIGREGKGPGEFSTLNHIGLLGDTLYASDNSLRRVSYFDTAGRFLRAVSWSTPLVRRPPLTFLPAAPQTIILDGSALVKAIAAFRLDLMPAGTIKLPFLHIDSAGETIDTIAWQELPRPKTGSIAHNGVEFPLGYHFTDEALYTLLADGSGLVVVERKAASNEEPHAFRVHKISPDGDTVFVRSYRYVPRPLPDAEVERVARDEQIRHRRGSPDVSPPGKGQIERALRRVGVPTMMTPISEIASGQDGTIWLGRELLPDRPRWWLALDPDGRLIGRLRLPAGQTIVASRDDILVVTEKDSFDVPSIVRYRLRK